ncbi:BgTH12-01114 [Blumeria graminis f. sp. triticale]|uniref:BgtA-20376 n=3 Tax=Blumeria graminis TaxID=34373 RepID=A0A9X9QFU7_BLUGR|nr:hypothetical protein BGT96224_A20376 [Blumeria graminis f. sp. tritici 96224]CAD6505624.1 BgTH12-01114 [Blumeria graminis f. sp. triticale]VDB93756.1 BgtA-20376 [Blumeria graminis f. sp. tritici]
MTSEISDSKIKPLQVDYDIVSNRIAAALAQRESLIKSWTKSSLDHKISNGIEVQNDSEDDILSQAKYPRLGLGAPIPSQFLVSDVERNNNSLLAKFGVSKTSSAGKRKAREQKPAASTLRDSRNDSSDEEPGRSSLGRAKKPKIDFGAVDDNKVNIPKHKISGCSSPATIKSAQRSLIPEVSQLEDDSKSKLC